MTCLQRGTLSGVVIGAGQGAVAGAVVGAAVAGQPGAAVGAVVGGVSGAMRGATGSRANEVVMSGGARPGVAGATAEQVAYRLSTRVGGPVCWLRKFQKLASRETTSCCVMKRGMAGA